MMSKLAQNVIVRLWLLLCGLQTEGAWGEQVVVKLLRDVLDDLLCFYAVSCVIEARRKDSDCAFAGSDGNDSSANAALCRQANVPGPTPGSVIESGHRHRGQNVG